MKNRLRKLYLDDAQTTARGSASLTGMIEAQSVYTTWKLSYRKRREF